MTAAGYDDYYRVRIRNRADSADLLVITSVPSGTNPYIKEPPHGDGASFNPMTNDQMVGSYTVLVTDAITSGTDRVITSQLEDVNGLLQLGFLKTFIENSRDGATWGRTLLGGYLTVARLVDAATWELTVQGALRALEGVRLFNPQSTTLITDFLTSWPVRGCVLGGPVMNAYAKGVGFPNLKDLGGWRMKVRSFGPDSFGVSRYQLAPVNVYGPPDFSPDHGHIKDYADVINQGVSQLPIQNENGTTGFTTVNDAQLGAMWQGLILLIDGVPFAPIAPYYSSATGNIRTVDPANPFIFVAQDSFAGGNNLFFGAPGLFARLHGQTPLTNNAIVKVRALTVLPSPISPVYLDRHPIDLLSDLCTLAGIGFNDTLGIKNLFGADLRETLRLTNPAITMGQLLKSAVYDLGIAIRSDASARIVPVATRKFSNALPTRTIDDTLVHEGSVSLPFEQDVSVGGLQTVTFRQKVFGQAGDSFAGGTPTRTDLALGRVVISNALDGITEREDTYTALNADANPMLSGAEEVAIAGQLRHSLAGQIAVDRTFWDTLAQELFDRFGRSNEQGELDLKRGDGTTDADLSDLGDEVLLSIKQLPNRNKRIGDDGSVGARAVQIIRLTETPARRPIRWSSSGANAQPLTTKPTLSIAATSDLPRTTAQTTVTNAATLNGLGYAVRFQMAVVAHGASAPASTAYVDYRITAPAGIPTTAMRMPSVTAGYDVYVRARSELAGHRPSDWSTVQHVSLSLIDDPTSVAAAAVAGDGSVEDLSWAIGTNAAADVTDIYIRVHGDSFANAVRFGTLLPGSTRFRVPNLTPATAYTASVQHRDPSSGDVSDPVEVDFTTDAATAVLDAPIGAVGFSESDDTSSVMTGLYGMACIATELPSGMEFQEAIETGIETDVYGTFNTIAQVPSVPDGFTVASRTAPNDGLRRQLRAREVFGPLVSGWTIPVTVTPWTYAPLSVAEEQESLNDFKVTDSTDGLSTTFSMTVGSRVERVLVFQLSQDAQANTDPWIPTTPSAVLAWYARGGTLTTLTPDVNGLCTLVVTKPGRKQQTFLQFEPRLEDWSPGFVRRAAVDPAASALTATLKGAVTNDTVDLTCDVQGALADWPVTVDFFADDPLGSVLATTSISANATLTKVSTGLSALGGLSLPLRAARRFYVRLTNAAGEVAWGNPIAVDRDSVPYGYVTITDFRVAPLIRITYDDDTDTVVLTIPPTGGGGGGTKTWSGLTGSGELIYTVGATAMDGGGVEPLLAVGGSRGFYYIDITGGGVTTRIWGSPSSGTGTGWVHGPRDTYQGQGSISIFADGSWAWQEDGGGGQDHLTYAESTSAFPSDGTAAAGTTISGRQAHRTGGSPLTFGQTLYVTIISYDNQGNALSSIRLRGSYQTFTSTRTTTFGIGSFIELNDIKAGAPANGFSVSTGTLQPNGNGTFDPQQKFYCIVVLPDGSTITDVYADVYSENDGSSGGSAQGHTTTFKLDRISSTGGSTGVTTNTAADNGGWQALHSTCSESTTGRRYIATWTTSQGSAPSTPSHTRLAGFYLVQTIPDPSKGV